MSLVSKKFVDERLTDNALSNETLQCIRDTGFKPDIYLKLCLLRYFQHRISPNVKFLTLNDTILLLNNLGYSFNGRDISTFVKLALRFKNLMKVVPQCIPIEKDQKFDEWFDKFLKKLKSQISETFQKIKAENDENETFIKNYLLSDTNIMKKNISLIEREIIKYSKDNNQSEENTVVEHINKDSSFSSEDDEPLNNIQKQLLEVPSTSNLIVNDTSVNNLRFYVAKKAMRSSAGNNLTVPLNNEREIPQCEKSIVEISNKNQSSNEIENSSTISVHLDEQITKTMTTENLISKSCNDSLLYETVNPTTSKQLRDKKSTSENVSDKSANEKNITSITVVNSETPSTTVNIPNNANDSIFNSEGKDLKEKIINENNMVITDVITLYDDDDENNDMTIIDSNSKNVPKENESEITFGSNVMNATISSNSKDISETDVLSEKTTTDSVTIVEIDGSENGSTENSQNSNDIVLNNVSNFLINKESINSVAFRTFIIKARNMYRVIKSPFIDNYFQKYCTSCGKLSLPPQKQLLNILCKNFLDINLYKRLEIYTNIVINIFKFCLENSPEIFKFTFETINSDQKLFNDILIQFKSMLKYMLYFCLEKLQIKLKILQKSYKKIASDVLQTPGNIKDLAIQFNVPSEAHFKTLRLISQSNIIDIKYSSLPKQGLTIRQMYNFPGVTIKCQFTDIEFGRTNVFNCTSCVTSTSRKTPAVVNKRIIGDKKLKLLEENEKDVALSTKFLMNYFHKVIVEFQRGEILGIKYIRDICTEFLKDVDFISPSRKAMVMNSEYHCSLSNYAYTVLSNVNMNRICLKHTINPEVKIFLKESYTPNQCFLTLICNLCNFVCEAFDDEAIVKDFSTHLIRVHGYFVDPYVCDHCLKHFTFQELSNKRWIHECYT